MEPEGLQEWDTGTWNLNLTNPVHNLIYNSIKIHFNIVTRLGVTTEGDC
jgi:hypothetical protein